MVEAPRGFTFVEDALLRAVGPLESRHLDFLMQNVPSLHAVLDMRRRGRGTCCADASVLEYFAARGIVVNELLYDEAAEEESLAAFATRCLSVLFSVLTKNDDEVLILGDGDLECFVIACLRRTMDWSIVSCIGEFYHNNISSNKDKSEEMVQFIEAFCPEEAKAFEHVPSFLSLHRQLAREEAKKKEIITQKRQQGVALEAEEELHERLFMAHGNEILTPGTVFDASSSLVNLKEEEDD